MRLSALEKARSAWPTAGITTSLSRAEPAVAGIAGILDGAGGAQDFVGGDAPALARQLIAAMGPADALQDAHPHQRLQHGFEMA